MTDSTGEYLDTFGPEYTELILEYEDWNPDSLLNADILGARSDDLREQPLLWILAKLEEFLPSWSGSIIASADSISEGWLTYSPFSFPLKHIGHSEYRNMHSKHLPWPHWLSKTQKTNIKCSSFSIKKWFIELYNAIFTAFELRKYLLVFFSFYY